MYLNNNASPYSLYAYLPDSINNFMLSTAMLDISLYHSLLLYLLVIALSK